jgi:hypothetical protein
MGTTARTVTRGALLLAALLACKGMEDSEDQSKDDEKRSEQQAKESAPTEVEKPKPQEPEAPPADPLLTLFSGPPKSVGTTKVPIRRNSAFSGAVVSAPTGWTGDKWDPEGVAGPAYSGDIYGDALLFSTADGYAYLHYKAEVITAEEPKQYNETDLKVHSYPAYITKVTWSAPVKGKLGHEDKPAWIWKGEGVGVMKGKGEPWKAYAASVAIGTKNVFVVGTWDASKPEYEAAVIDGIKAIRG